MRESISAAERMALTLRFLATGESFHSLAVQFCISRHAISYIRSAVKVASHPKCQHFREKIFFGTEIDLTPIFVF